MKNKRRTFLIAGAGTTAALVLGWVALPGTAAAGRVGDPRKLIVNRSELGLNGWLKLGVAGELVLVMPRSEMGQGIHTALAQIAAEELGVSLGALKIEGVQLGSEQDAIYGNVAMFEGSSPFAPIEIEKGGMVPKTMIGSLGKTARNLGLVVTGGSSSVADAFAPLSLAAAVARETLKAAAAARLRLDAQTLRLDDTGVTNGRQRVSFAQLAASGESLASYMPKLESIKLKDPKTYSQIGKPAPRVDIAAKSRGQARFGIDMRLPGMVYAALVMSPVIGGKLKSMDAGAIADKKSVVGVFALKGLSVPSEAAVVVARSYWHASTALAALKLEWDEGANASFSSDAYMTQLKAACKAESGFGFMGLHTVGDADAALKAGKLIEAEMQAPYLAHAPMEPMNCTAQYKDGRLSVWASTQVPAPARYAAARAAGLQTDAVDIHVQYLGGGFGRRLEVDFIVQAAALAMKVQPAPVKLVWSREQDTTHDMYRPAQAAWLRATLGADGRVAGYVAKTAGAAITPQIAKRIWGLPDTGPDKTANEGIFDTPYQFGARSAKHVLVDSPVPVGYWRAVGHSMNAFFSETFVDMLAKAAGTDPLAFRLKHLEHAPRRAAVLKLAAEKAGWGKPLSAGRAHGIALHESFGTIVAQVVEASLQGGKPVVHKVTAAVDCGLPINPNIIAQQMESAVIFGLSAALYGRIDIKNGRVQQSNFHDYPMAALKESPMVETHIVASTAAPAGMGEPGLPPLAPALNNALAKLTGKYALSLPLQSA